MTICLVVTIVGMMADNVRAAVRRLTIQELNESDSKFVGAEIAVEGRVAVIGAKSLQFRNCTIPFRSEEELTVNGRKPANAEVTGEMTHEVGRYVFQIRSLQVLPSDLETFVERKRRIRTESPPATWYTLADWAEQRGNFYKDHELLARADEARRQGVHLERQSARDRPRELLALAERVKKMDLPDSVRGSIVHEAYHALWKDSRTSPPEKLEPLAKELADNLPGSLDPLRVSETKLVGEYVAKPLEVYDAADDATRRKLHRFLYAEVLQRFLNAKLAVDASNGFEVADLIEKQIPEHHSLAESLRDKALASRAAEIEKLPRRELLALRDQYLAREQPKQAEQVVESWLTLRRRRLAPDDTEGLLQLADEYRTLLKRADMADRLLLEAWQRNPAPEVAEQLQRYGYRQKDGKWLTLAEFNARPEERLEQALREGRIEKGMTGRQVRRGLGEPLSLTRTATAGQVSEIWSYSQIDKTRLTVHLVKRRGQEDLHVIEVTQVRLQ